MSYRKKHVKNKISRIKPKKPMFLRMWFWLIILTVVVLGLTVYLLFFFSGLQIKNIIISGNQKVLTQDLENLVQKDTTIKLANLGFLNISIQSILLADSQKISQNILSRFPIIDKAEVFKKLPQTIVLEVTERKPIGVFCPPEGKEQNCFLIDRNGVAYEPVSIIFDRLFIVRQTFDEKQVLIGEEIINKNIASDISEIQKNLNDKFQINLVKALITSPLRMDVTTSENWKIYFNMGADSNINTQLVKLDLLLSEEISADERLSLEYIDLRFKDRAFYK